MATADPSDVRIPIDDALREPLARARALTGLSSSAEVFRLALTTLVRKLEADARIGG